MRCYYEKLKHVKLVVYKERNSRIFEDKTLCLQDLKFYFLRILHNSSHALNGGISMCFFGFVDNIMHRLECTMFAFLPLFYMSDIPLMSI